MSLLLPAAPAAGFNENTEVRTAVVDGVRMVSVFDIIKTAIGGSLNAREYWCRISKTYPDLLAGVKTHKFEGQGQRDTPVVDAHSVVMLLNLIPGKTAANFRIHFADIVVRFLGGDGTLVAEIKRNADLQESIDSEDPRSIFGDAVRNKRSRDEDNDLSFSDTQSRIVERNINSMERAAALLERLNGGKLDGPSTLMLKDATQNALAPFSSRLLSVGGHQERHQMPISDLYREITGCGGTKNEWIRIGTAVAKEYRLRHNGQEPASVERAIGGTTRMVKAYSLIEDPWVRDFIRQMIGNHND